jgi:DNA mismatch endonuclease, patch repair protein
VRGDGYVPWASSPEAGRIKAATTGRDTRPELRVRSALHRRGYRFRVNFQPLPALRRTADIAFPRLRLAVFIDGCFWHGCELHHRPPRTNAHYWSGKVGRNIERDQDTNCRLLEAGWTPLRIWEHEATDDAVHVIAVAIFACREALNGGELLDDLPRQ